jgi:hypothetical protein
MALEVQEFVRDLRPEATSLWGDQSAPKTEAHHSEPAARDAADSSKRTHLRPHDARRAASQLSHDHIGSMIGANLKTPVSCSAAGTPWHSASTPRSVVVWLGNAWASWRLQLVRICCIFGLLDVAQKVLPEVHMSHCTWAFWMSGLFCCISACTPAGETDETGADGGGERQRSMVAADAGCPTCLPPVDASTKSTLVPPTDTSDAATDSCKQAEHLDCKRVPCSWSEAQAKLPSCANPPLAPWIEARCGDFRTFVALGTDSAIYYLYDHAGELVAYVEKGLSARGCFALELPFDGPNDCDVITPECPPPGDENDAGL